MNLSPREALQLIHPDLLARVAKGDHKALAQLYDQSSSVLFTLAVRILGGAREAGELVQQIYLDLWRKSVRYDPHRGTPMVWLITLTRNRAVDRLRARLASAPPGTEPKEKPTPARDSAPSTSLKGTAALDDLRAVIAKALESLSDSQKQALELAYFQGWTYADIAARQHEPQERVKAGLIVGLNTLKGTHGSSWDQDSRDGA